MEEHRMKNPPVVFPPGTPGNPNPPKPCVEAPVTEVIHVEPELDWSPLSDFAIAEIHAGLEIPNKQVGRRMAREIRKWRGVPNPDEI